jgi:hypothetical protein
MKHFLVFLAMLFLSLAVCAQRWPISGAEKWYKQQIWLIGANFIPSTTINQLEMWQKETYDPATITRELGYAENLGMNTMRVFLHHAAWEEDPQGFKQRLNGFLDTCKKHHMKPMLVLFDDCWSPTYHTGQQPGPKAGTHNSGWLQDPGERYYTEPKLQDTLETYVKDIIGTFKDDDRILLWDLYNEPGNNRHFDQSLDLLKKVFGWAREINPSQPLTAGYWAEALPLDQINAFILENSDIITYHSYEDAEQHQVRIDRLKVYGRPLICTEYMARKRNSTFFNITPLLKAQNIGAINWGLVDGKTQTKYGWDELIKDGSEPKLWFHDIFHKDGTPYDPKETDFIKSLTKRKDED